MAELDYITEQIGGIRLSLEDKLSERLGKFQNGTPAICVWPPAPQASSGLLALICGVEIPIQQSPRGAYQIQDYYAIEVALRQPDKTAKGIIDLRIASDAISSHYPKATRITHVGKENKYNKDDDRDLIVIFRIPFHRSIDRCID